MYKKLYYLRCRRDSQNLSLKHFLRIVDTEKYVAKNL